VTQGHCEFFGGCIFVAAVCICRRTGSDDERRKFGAADASRKSAAGPKNSRERHLPKAEKERVVMKSMMLEDPFDPPTISKPNLFTAQSAVPKVDEATGALVHRVALEIPPGRNGLTPDLQLVYNSQQLDDGIVGYGWSLSIPYIKRLNRTGSGAYTATSTSHHRSEVSSRPRPA
jgi:Salmonella virulence plasmid 65kDa B protein